MNTAPAALPLEFPGGIGCIERNGSRHDDAPGEGGQNGISSSKSSAVFLGAPPPLPPPGPLAPPGPVAPPEAPDDSRLPLARARVEFDLAAAGLARAADQLHPVADDLGRVLLDPVLVGVLRVWRRPSMYTERPFLRYSPAISAVRPNSRRGATRYAPASRALSFHCSDVAMLRLATALPSIV